jgi:hypothetical protein
MPMESSADDDETGRCGIVWVFNGIPFNSRKAPCLKTSEEPITPGVIKRSIAFG